MIAVVRLPWPPSLNHYRTPIRSRLILTAAARQYVERCAVLMLEQRVPKLRLAVPLRLDLEARQPNRLRRDLDGILKQPLDALTKHGLIADDCWIHDLRVWWGEPVAGGSLRLRLYALAGDRIEGDSEAMPPS